jgi:hypothetical protein
VTHKAVAVRAVLLVYLYFFMLARRHVLTAPKMEKTKHGENKAKHAVFICVW